MMGAHVHPSPGTRILIVDDEIPLLENLARAARKEGYRVDTARSGEEAWDLLEQFRYDVVVTDLRMPGMAGPELMGRIAGRGIPTRVVVITGYATLEAAVDCLRKGAVDFLVKPFEVETFLASVDKALQRPLPEADPDWEGLARAHGLTARQVEVIEALYRTGMTNRELADHLGVSPHTIKSHIRTAFQKLGVANRTQFLRKVRSATALSPPPEPAPGASDPSWEG